MVCSAPTAPSKRTSIRSKASKSGSGVYVPPKHREGAIISDSFINSKKDKRIIKHSALVNRIEKAHSKPLKRRRPNKKLVTTLESLADALPDFEGEGLDKISRGESGKIKQKSMKSRPGATKRREKLEAMERERFGKNMAQLVGSSESKTEAMATSDENKAPVSGTSSRWAALRGFISQTMEQKEEFRKA
ncbi:ribosome biogenesis SLX9-domain-containing protein [Rutstroemia sp. NJR-2017a WRK4]|nr:ribosome biogenesis SLX9-domain-containing protein [Rutstroemia sp. NJR-2017a WRK4]